MQLDWINALIGGVIIGFSVSLMLLWNGRVTGISGIINGVFSFQKDDMAWRLSFLGALFGGGVFLRLVRPDFFDFSLPSISFKIVIAGLLVGFGTILGSGCTSGHGVCGVSRVSPRSLLATVIFISAGVLSVFLLRQWGFHL